MSAIGSQVISAIGVASMVCLLVSGIILLHIIQKAFDRDGVLWGIIAILYPVGTYFFCRKSWDEWGSKFILITALLVAYLIFWLVVRFI